MQDMEFISGRFFDYEIPKEKRYLKKYFQTELQEAFLRYFLIFGQYRNFKSHTGHHCNPRMLFKLRKKLEILEIAYNEAKVSLTEDGMRTVQLIETGKFPLTNK